MQRHQYYETICGGAGAGAEFQRRVRGPHPYDQYPHHRPGNSRTPLPGPRRDFCHQAKFRRRRRPPRGGNGVVRKIRFLEAMTATIVASRRTHSALRPARRRSLAKPAANGWSAPTAASNFWAAALQATLESGRCHSSSRRPEVAVSAPATQQPADGGFSAATEQPSDGGLGAA